MSYVRRARHGDESSGATAKHLANLLLELRARGTPYWCWGYSFPWQTRHTLVPRYSPNLVCTTFAAQALLDAHEAGLGNEFLGPAVSAGQYIANELYWEDGERAAFAYPSPEVRIPIHNANFLGAALLGRLARFTGDTAAVGTALTVARYSARGQREDGAWPYGQDPAQQWVDNFHTGYNLCSLRSIGQELGTEEFEANLENGLAYFIRRFVTSEGAPGYFDLHTYPIDIHSAAQTIITLLDFADREPGAIDLAHLVHQWTMRHMWDPRGYFYYRVHRFFTNRISYLRWAQAWMFMALTLLAEGASRPSAVQPAVLERQRVRHT